MHNIDIWAKSSSPSFLNRFIITTPTANRIINWDNTLARVHIALLSVYSANICWPCVFFGRQVCPKVLLNNQQLSEALNFRFNRCCEPALYSINNVLTIPHLKSINPLLIHQSQIGQGHFWTSCIQMTIYVLTMYATKVIYTSSKGFGNVSRTVDIATSGSHHCSILQC